MKGIENIRDYLEYCQDSGIFTWKKTRGKALAGSRAGYITVHGYRTIGLFGRHYRAGRLAIYFVTGIMPKIVDHINGKRDDDRYANLRNVTVSLNMKNAALRNDNLSGVPGVSKVKLKNGGISWLVKVYADGKEIRLAQTKDFFEAVCIRKSAENQLYYHPNHGRLQSLEAQRWAGIGMWMVGV